MIKHTDLIRFGAKGKMFDDLCLLIKTEEDLREFESIYNSESEIMFAISEYRSIKVERNKMPYEDFAVAFVNDSKKTLEHVFQHPVTQDDLDKLRERLNDRLSLHSFYMMQQKNPELRMLRLIL